MIRHSLVKSGIATSLVVVGALVSNVARAQEAPAQGVTPAPAAAPAPVAAPAPSGSAQNPVIVQLHPETGSLPTTVALSGPAVIHDWEEGTPPPAGYHTETRLRKGLIIGGAVPFGVLYLISAYTAAIGSDHSYDNQALWIPAIGPFIQFGKSDSGSEKFLCAVNGIGQTAGLAMLLTGILSPKTVLVRNDLGFQVRPIPIVARDAAGVGLGGTF